MKKSTCVCIESENTKIQDPKRAQSYKVLRNICLSLLSYSVKINSLLAIKILNILKVLLLI